MPTKEPYNLLQDEDVVTPLLSTKLIEGAQRLIQNGVPPQLICEVFQNVCDKVVMVINRLAVSMDGFDMKAVLSKYFATQLPTQLFGPFRTHIANIIVAAVYASGYDYEGAGPYENNIDDFEGGFNLIGIRKVLGGSVDDSFFVEGIGIAFKTHVDGLVNLDVVENPEILILNIKPDQNSQIKDSADVSINCILSNHVRRLPNVVLTNQAIDDYSKKELANRSIYFADLVSKDDLDHVAKATYATISSNHNYSQSILIRTCKSFQQKIFGNEVFGIFSGCEGKVASIVLQGNEQFVEEAEMYVHDLIPEVRTVMNEYKLVDGGRKLYCNIIRYVREEANNADKDSKTIMDAFADAIQATSDKIHDNAGCNPSEKHAIAPGVGNIVWAPPSIKFHAIYAAALIASSEIEDLK